MKKLLCVLAVLTVYIAIGLIMEQFINKSELLWLLCAVMYGIPLISAVFVGGACLLMAMFLWPLVVVGVVLGGMALWDWLLPAPPANDQKWVTAGF